MAHHKTDRLYVLPFFVTIPHSGEFVPEEASWLKGLSEPHLMRDVDRYVDQLYIDSLNQLEIPYITTDCHRYVIDQNRLPTDFDAQSVENSENPAGTHPKGLHWSKTTLGEPLILKPLTQEAHKKLVQKYYEPFHEKIKVMFASYGSRPVYHLDAHSMPSMGTKAHNDPGETRADVVVSDFHGKSCQKEFTQLVIKAYKDQGFKVAHNWPYFGGGITQMYGHPSKNHHTLQVELNRKIYMNEDTKKKNSDYEITKQKINQALNQIKADLKELIRH